MADRPVITTMLRTQSIICLQVLFATFLLLSMLPIRPAVALGIYLSHSIKGTIIDANTKAPIEGVIVTASWIQTGITGHGQVTLKVSETVTDKKGEYTLPGWGPKVYFDVLDRNQPVVRFFKQGYAPLVIPNNSAYHPGLENDTEHLIKEPIKRSDGHIAYWLNEPEGHQVKFGKKKHTFMLVPFDGSDAEYVELLLKSGGYVESLDILTGGGCEWKHLPITFSTLHKLKARLDALNVNTNIGIGLPYVFQFGGQDKCGNAEEYFRGYLK